MKVTDSDRDPKGSVYIFYTAKLDFSCLQAMLLTFYDQFAYFLIPYTFKENFNVKIYYCSFFQKIKYELLVLKLLWGKATMDNSHL